MGLKKIFVLGNKKNRRISYTSNFKKTKKTMPKELVRDVLKQINSTKFTKKTIIYNKNLKLRIIKNTIKNTFSNTSATYAIEIKNNKEIKKYFIKEINSKKDRVVNPQFLMGLTGVNEMIGLNFIDKFIKKNNTVIAGYKLKVLPNHFAYEDYNNKKSYIMYDYTELNSIKQAREKNLISENLEKAIKNELSIFKEKINNEIKHDLKKYKNTYLNNTQKIDDIYIRNLFIDIKNKTLFFSDAWLK